ncbi:MAG TPA: SulP family inorganic anion transporter [Solirubrobacteraceae bacterium]|nr:SulP family inorganic anion transporter [Solirubrobacteraceae bacterium]
MATSPPAAAAPARRSERLLPPLRTLRGYGARDLRRDAAAGLAVWAAAVPSGLAYAGLAGLPPIVGLYASAVAGLAYGLAGSIRQAQVGPTSTSSILTAAAIAPMAHGDVARATGLAALLALEVAAILLLAWALRLGFLADLLSRPVLVGFTAAISLVIIAAQLPSLLGVTGVDTRSFQATLGGLGDRLGAIDADSVAIGAGVLVALLVLRRVRPRWPRELLVVATATLLVSVLGLQDTVRVVGDVPGGLPAPALPAIGYADVERLVPAAAGIALIAFVETVAIGRTFATAHHYPIDSRDEFLALGAANLAAGVFQGYPANASFAQTALSDGAGGRTVVASVTTKVAILATLLVLTPLFADLPYPALAAVVIAAVLSFIDIPAFRRLLRFQRAAQRSRGAPGGVVPRQPEFWSAVAAFAGTLLFGILNGILVGVLVTLLAVLHRLSRPRVAVLGKVPGGKRHRDIHRHPDAKEREGVLIVRFEAPVFFGNADYFRASVLGLVDEHRPPPGALVVVCDAMSDIDVTGLDALRELIESVQRRGIELRMCRVKGPVHDALLENGLVELVGARHFYDSVRAAKKGLAPDGLPVIPETGTQAAGPTP